MVSHKVYRKGRMNYLNNGRIFNIPSKFRNFPKRFRIINTAGAGYCGYYALNIGLGMCGKYTNNNAQIIKNEFKNFVNAYGNKNVIPYIQRNSSSPEWVDVNNGNVAKMQFSGNINNGLGYFNRYRTGVKNNLNWVEISFWIWACNHYQVEINIFGQSEQGRGWSSYKPHTIEKLCKIYVFNQGDCHYSAMEPVEENNNNSGMRPSGSGAYSISNSNNNNFKLAMAHSLNTYERNQRRRNRGQSSGSGAGNVNNLIKIMSRIHFQKEERNRLEKVIQESLMGKLKNIWNRKNLSQEAKVEEVLKLYNINRSKRTNTFKNELLPYFNKRRTNALMGKLNFKLKGKMQA